MLSTLILPLILSTHTAAATAPQPPRVTLLENVEGADRRLRLSQAARDRLLSARGRVTVDGLRLPGGDALELSMERFEVAAPNIRFVLGRDRAELGFDPSRVALYRGAVAGAPASAAFLAVTDVGAGGVLGIIDLGPGAPRFVLGSRDAARRGLVGDDLALVEAAGFGAPLMVEPCVMLTPEAPPAEGGVAGITGAQRRLIELAVDTDFEFYALFGDAEAAAAYVLALYGAVSQVYDRELQARVAVTFVRLWDAPEDLFNEPDPLFPFVEHWNAFMGDVPRDVAQLLSGRRNLPYGGVAFVSALCGDLGYSVNGYLNGAFADVSAPEPGNWDLIVVAHELGHNCGTFHSHNYGLDDCAGGEVRRGGIMSYCHTVSGGVSNVDVRFHTFIRGVVAEFLADAACLGLDCDGNGIDDAVDIAEGRAVDVNGDGIPDACQDCDGDGVLDPEEIADGAPDIDGNGMPDACQPDCNGNGIPDRIDIGFGAALDLYGDGVPDECEADCDGDGVSDYTQIIANMALDVDRNAALDACQDCDRDGVPDLAQLQGAMNLWVAGGDGLVREFHGRSGAPTQRVAVFAGGPAFDLVLLRDGRVAASVLAIDAIATFDPLTGAAAGELVAPGAGGLDAPAGMVLLPDGRLLVASSGSSSILEFDADTGAFVGVFAEAGTSPLSAPLALAPGAEGELLAGSSGGRVLRFSLATGAFLGVLVPAGSGGAIASPTGLLLLPGGDLLIADGGAMIRRHDGVTGEFLGRWDQGGVLGGLWGLQSARSLKLSADGRRVLATNSAGGAAVHSYDLQSGYFLRSFYVLATDVAGASGLLEIPPSPQDCNLNFVPDACDIASGASLDADGDGVPDECGRLLPGDLDGDGDVDGADLGFLLGAWGPCAACPADLTGDGMIDGADLGVLLGSWTTG